MTSSRLALVAAAAVAILMSLAQVSRAQPPAAPVVVAEYDGVIHPIAAEFFDDVIDRANEVNAAAVVLVLRTPGGLLESTRTMVSRMIASAVPVVVYVSPAGSRAASAGFILALAADVAAMAPGTHIGAAHPVTAFRRRRKPLGRQSCCRYGSVRPDFRRDYDWNWWDRLDPDIEVAFRNRPVIVADSIQTAQGSELVRR